MREGRKDTGERHQDREMSRLVYVQIFLSSSKTPDRLQVGVRTTGSSFAGGVCQQTWEEGSGQGALGARVHGASGIPWAPREP